MSVACMVCVQRLHKHTICSKILKTWLDSADCSSKPDWDVTPTCRYVTQESTENGQSCGAGRYSCSHSPDIFAQIINPLSPPLFIAQQVWEVDFLEGIHRCLELWLPPADSKFTTRDQMKPTCRLEGDLLWFDVGGVHHITPFTISWNSTQYGVSRTSVSMSYLLCP